MPLTEKNKSSVFFSAYFFYIKTFHVWAPNFNVGWFLYIYLSLYYNRFFYLELNVINHSYPLKMDYRTNLSLFSVPSEIYVNIYQVSLSYYSIIQRNKLFCMKLRISLIAEPIWFSFTAKLFMGPGKVLGWLSPPFQSILEKMPPPPLKINFFKQCG